MDGRGAGWLPRCPHQPLARPGASLGCAWALPRAPVLGQLLSSADRLLHLGAPHAGLLARRLSGGRWKAGKRATGVGV